MAQNPKYGGTKADLDAAIAATEAKSGAISDLEAKTKRLSDAEAENATIEARGEQVRRKNVGARDAGTDSIVAQSEALERNIARLNAETKAIAANTEALLAQARARGGSSASAVAASGAPRYAPAVGDLGNAVTATRTQAGAVAELEKAEASLQRTRSIGATPVTASTSARIEAAVAQAQLSRARAIGPSALSLLGGQVGAPGGAGIGPNPGAVGALGGAYGQARLISGIAGKDLPTASLSAYAAAEEHVAQVSGFESAARAKSNELLEQSVGSYSAGSQALQRHGALTAEFVQGLVRGEVTLKEFESQLGITIGKFAGWAVAGGLVYGAYDAVKKLYDGLVSTQSGVEQLKRSLGEKVDGPVAAEGFRRVASEVNVSIREVADAQFYASRIFHDQADSLALASTALKAYKLDNVNTQDAIKSFGAINAAFGSGPKEIQLAFDQLDVGQLKFNARLQQTLPQVGRAAASYAAAGGTLKQLIDQTIQINRATGGGGGTGGGNPATALLREPANLTRPESEATLRRFGYNPKDARQNIGRFNQEVQENKKLSEQDRQELAKAAGGGAGVGFRYLLPLFRLGTTGIPKAEREATEPQNAAGSSAEDLKHKLAQVDEQIGKLGVDFEVFGSEVGGGGIEATLGDALTAINFLIKGVGLIVSPFAALGQVLTNLPGPLRVALEGFLAFRGAQLAGRSGVGLAGRSLLAESSLVPSYSGGGAPEVRDLTTTQRKYLELLTNQREAATVTAIRAGQAVAPAATRLESFRKTPAEVSGLSEDERVAYRSKEASLEAALVRAYQAQVDAADALAAIEAQAVERKELLAVLEDKKISTSAKLAAAEDARLYASSGGSPNFNPLLGPAGREATAGERAAVRGASGPLAKSAQEAAAGAGALGAEADVAAASSIVAPSMYARAGSSLRNAGGTLASAASGLRSFISNLGFIGKGVAAFVALDVLNQIDGANSEFAQGASRLQALREPVTEGAIVQQLKQVKPNYQDAKGPGGVAEYLKATGHDILAIPQHPIQAIESLFGASHPGTFSSDQREAENELAKKQAKRLREGAFKGLGEGGKLSPAFVENAEETSYLAVESIEKGDSSEKVEKAEKAIESQIKLRLDELKSFGAGKFGEQTLQRLDAESSGLAARFAQSGSSTVFEELAKDDEQITAGVISSIQQKIANVSKLANTEGERQTALKEADALLRQRIQEGVVKPLSEASQAINQTAFNTQQLKSRYNATGDTKQKEQLEKAIKAEEKKESAERSNFAKLQEKARTEKGTAKIAEESYHKEIFQAEVTPLRARSSLNAAKDGADKTAAAEDALKLIIEEEGKANKDLVGTEKKQELLALQAKRVAAEEALVAEKVNDIKSDSARKIAELPIGDNVGKANLEVQTDKKIENFIKGNKHLSPRSKAKQLQEAHTTTLQAEKAAEEAILSEATSISQLNTQIAEAGDSGNAVAQAQDALAGAQAAAKLAKRPTEKLQARLDAINAANQLQQANQSRISALGELAESKTQDPLKQAKIKLGTDKRLLAGATPDERIKDQAGLNNDQHKYTETLVSTRSEEIEFNRTMQNISTQTAIAQYESLLKTHGLAKKTRDDLLSKIRGLQNEIGVGNNQVYDLAPGSIKLPTAYDVHRAIASAATAGNFLHSGDDNSSVRNEINITVSKDSDIHRVADVLDKAMHSGVRARLRAAGVRGS